MTAHSKVAPEDRLPLKGGNGEVMDSTETIRPLVENGEASPTRVVAPLTLLPQEALDTYLKRIGYHVVEKVMRVLPFFHLLWGHFGPDHLCDLEISLGCAHVNDALFLLHVHERCRVGGVWSLGHAHGLDDGPQ